MGCNGCPEDKTENNVDKRGNVIGQSELGQEEVVRHQNTVAQRAREMSYSEFKSKRAEFRNHNRAEGNQVVDQFSDEYKRIQIDELVSVYNYDEVNFKLTPDQALVALWEFCHHPSYQKVFKEFEGLSEQIDKKFSKLKEDSIDLKWKP